MENLWLKEHHHTAGLTSWGAYHIYTNQPGGNLVYTIKP